MIIIVLLENKIKDLLLSNFNYKLEIIKIDTLNINQRYCCIFDNKTKLLNFMPIGVLKSIGV